MMFLKSACYTVLSLLLGAVGLVGVSCYTSLTPKAVAISKFTEALEQPVGIKIKVPEVVVSVNNAVYEEGPKPVPEMLVEKRPIPPKPIKVLVEKKTDNSTQISNEELVKHYGFVASLPETIDLVKYYEQAGVMTTLIALQKQFSTDTQSANRFADLGEESDIAGKNLEDIVTEVKSARQREDNADEMVFFDLTKKHTTKTTSNNNATIENETIEIGNAKQEAKEKETLEIPVLLKEAVLNAPRVVTAAAKPMSVPDITFEPQISSRVEGAIKRIRRDSPAKQVKRKREVMRGVAKSIAKSIPPSTDHSIFHAEKREVNINAYSIDVGGKHPEKVSNFQFIPNYDESEVVSSDSDGIMSIQLKEGESGVIRGRFVAMGHIRMVADIPIGSVDNLEVPLIDEGVFNTYIDGLIKEQSAPADVMHGGHVLAYVEEAVEDISIDGDYKAKILLSDNFSVVKDDSYSYIMFLGVDPGNTVISYLYDNGGVAEKISYVSYDEVLFEFGMTTMSKHTSISLYERGLLSKESKELNINKSDINYFNRDVKFSSAGFNKYEYKRPKKLLGMRDYLKLEHLGDSIYVGHDGWGSIEVPSRGFIEEIMKGFEIDTLDRVCFVQVNLPKNVSDLKANLESQEGSSNINTIYLDTDGEFVETPTAKTEKAFFVGELEGVFSLKIKYSNNKRKIFNSFCSMGAYIVEQL